MITIISGTNRLKSNSYKLAQTLSDLLNSHGIKAQILGLHLLQPDFAYQKIQGNVLPEFDEEMIQKIKNVNKFIFILAEYNGSYPGICKSLLDSVPPAYFKGKKSGLIGLSSGRTGALKALDDFTGVLHYLQVEVLSDKPKLAHIEDLIRDNATLLTSDVEKRLTQFIKKFEVF